jgi:hypothetical protein
MSFASNAKEDRSAGIVPGVRPHAAWRIVAAEAQPGYRLNIRFRDGLEGTVDMRPLLESRRAGVFSILRDPALFSQVQVVLGAVTWPGELDLAPDAMYDAIKACGEWVPD